MKIKWVRLALTDLEKSSEFIAKDNPEATKRMVKRIWNATQKGIWVRSLTLTFYRFVPGIDEIVFSIYDLILVWFSNALGDGDRLPVHHADRLR